MKTVKHILLITVFLTFSYFSAQAQNANEKPEKLFARGLKAAYENGETWTTLDVHLHKNKIVNFHQIGNNVMKNDTQCDADPLGYSSLKVEKGVYISETIDLRNITTYQDIRILVDDEVTLTIEAESSDYTFSTKVDGTAIWRARSFKPFRTSIPPGDRYTFTISYSNTANLTQKYGGVKDVDGVAVYLHDSLFDHELNLTKAPKYLFGSTKYATPISFKCEPKNFDVDKVEIKSIECELTIDDVVMKTIDLSDRFVAVIDGVDQQEQKNGESDEYTCFVKATDLYDVEVPNGKFITDKFQFKLKVKWSYIKDETEEMVISTSRFNDHISKVFRFADRNVFAMDIPVAGNESNTKILPISEGRYHQDLVDKPGVSRYDLLTDPAANGMFYAFDNPGDSRKNEISIHEKGIKIDCSLIDNEDERLIDPKDREDVLKSSAYGVRRGGYMFVSYGGKRIGILDVGEISMDLDQTKGHFDWALFGNTTFKVTNAIEESGGLNLSRVSSGFGIASALTSLATANPLGAALGLASSIAALYSDVDDDDEASHDRADAIILEVLKVMNFGDNIQTPAKVDTIISRSDDGNQTKTKTIVDFGSCNVGQQWTYFVDMSVAVTAKARNFEEIKVSSIAELNTTKQDFEQMQIKMERR